jgi:hypothetical protein
VRQTVLGVEYEMADRQNQLLRKPALVLILSLLGTLCASGSGTAWALEKKISRSEISPDMVTTSNASKISVNMNALRRLDFVVKGSSCPACLLKIQKRLEKTPGVAQAGVMLTQPYGAVCIYDGSKVDKNKLILIGIGTEKLVKFVDVEDEKISKMPIVLIPHHATDPGAGAK